MSDHYGLKVGDRVKGGHGEGVIEDLSKFDANRVYVRLANGDVVAEVAEWCEKIEVSPAYLIVSAMQSNDVRLTYEKRWMVVGIDGMWEVYAPIRGGGRGMLVIETYDLEKALLYLMGDSEKEQGDDKG